MDPRLVDRYKKYKAGTTKLVSWLVNATRDCQNIIAIVPSLQHAENSASSTTSDAKIAVNTLQMLQLARIVQKSSITVPEDISRTLKAVIAGRELCARWYSALRDEASSSKADQNEGHQHFIEVLRQIQSLLDQHSSSSGSSKPLGTSKPAKSAPSSDTSQQAETLANMFSALEVQEPASEPPEPSAAARATTHKVKIELQDDTETKTFAIWCLLQDMRDLRYEIGALWKRYVSGDVGLDIAGSVSEFAIGLLRQAEFTFRHEHQDIQSYDDVMKYLGLKIQSSDHGTFILPRRNAEVYAAKHKSVSSLDIASTLCPKAFVIVSAVQYIVREGQRGAYETSIARFNNELLRHPFGGVLAWLIPGLYSMKAMAQETRPWLYDSLTGLQSLADAPSRHCSIFHVVGLQMAMDIHTTLKFNSDNEINLFKASLSRGGESIHKFSKIVGRGEQWDALLKTQLEYLKDPYQTAFQDIKKRKPGFAITSAPLFQAYGCFPSVPGRMMHESAMDINRVGLALCNQNSLVLSMAYLYKVALSVGAITQTWPDMELILETQSKQRAFILEPAIGIASLEQWAKCFGRALGMNLEAFLREARPRLPSEESIHENGRKLISPCPIVKILQADEPQNAGLSFYVTGALASLESLKKTGHKSERLEHVFKQYEKTNNLTPTQLLLCLEAAFEENHVDLRFDYIEFAASLKELMTTMYQSLEPSLDSLFGSRWQVDDWELPYSDDRAPLYEVVYAALWDAEDRASSRKALEKGVLFNMAKLMEQHINRRGDLHSKAAQKEPNRRNALLKTQQQLQSCAADRSLQEDLEEIRNFLGLPTTEAEAVGAFCYSREEAESRSQVAKALAGSKKKTTEQDFKTIKQAMVKAMRINLQRMTEDDKQEVKAKMGRIEMAVNSKSVAAVKILLNRVGLGPQEIVQMMSKGHLETLA